jgi:dTDP-4-amino-4,6-dideoxygalactose transaminase
MHLNSFPLVRLPMPKIEDDRGHGERRCLAAIPFHRPAVGEDEALAAADAVRSGWLTTGERTVDFERQFAQFVGAESAVAVSSGTAALHLSLICRGVGVGDEVLVPANTFTATAEAVALTGARPVLVDIDSASLNISCLDAQRKITPRTRAIIAVHVGGMACAMDEIDALAHRHGLGVVEDAAHALPTRYRGRMVGSISEFTAFSFYATKTLTTGEGGMITTSDARAARRLRRLRLHGIEREGARGREQEASWKYHVAEAGYKYNLTDFQAAIGLVQLKKCEALRQARERISARYTQAFARLETIELRSEPAAVRGAGAAEFGFPAESEAENSQSWHLYIVRIRPGTLEIDREQFIQALEHRGIGASVHFMPLNLHPRYQHEFGYRRGDFPVAEAEYRRSLSLPIFPDMQDAEIERVIDAVCEIAQGAKLPSKRVAARTAMSAGR